MKVKIEKYLPRVIDFEYHSEYKLIIYFDDGKVKLVDLKPHLWGEVFEPLKDLREFKRIKIRHHTITWAGDIDFAPETLYEIGIDITPKRTKSQALRHPARLRKSA